MRRGPLATAADMSPATVRGAQSTGSAKMARTTRVACIGQRYASLARRGRVVLPLSRSTGHRSKVIRRDRSSGEWPRRSQIEFRDVIETIPAMAWTANPDSSNAFVKKRWTEYTGLSVEMQTRPARTHPRVASAPGRDNQA